MGHYVRDLWSTLRAIESDEVAASVLRTVERGSGRASGWAIAKAMDKDPQAALEALKKLKDLELVDSVGSGLEGYYYLTALGSQVEEALGLR